MTSDVITLNSETDSLEKAEYLFKKNKIRHIPVVNHLNKILGILSETDLLRISFEDAINESDKSVDTSVYKMFTVNQVMAKNVTSIHISLTIKEAAEIFADKGFHALPVIERGKLVGIVTTTDLIKCLLQLL